MMKVALAGRAAEQVVFGRVTNGAANDLEKVTEIARAMVFECGMSEEVAVAHDARRQLRALRGDEAAARHRAGRLTDEAYAEAVGCSRSTALRSTGSRRRCSRRRRSVALRSCSCSRTSRPSRARQRRSACRRSSLCLATDPSRLMARVGYIGPTCTSLGSIGSVRPRGIHHLGVAVEDLDAAVETYERLFGAEARARATVGDQGVEAASLRVGGDAIELLAPLGEETPVGRFLAKRGPGMHHVAYEVERRRCDPRRACRRRRGAHRRAARAQGCSGSRSPSSIRTPSTASSSEVVSGG